MPKRKYVHTIMSSVVDRCNKLRQYQTMTEAECLARLLDILDNKSPCTKFCNHSNLTPTSHNMVTTSHINSNVTDIDLKTIALCMKNTSYDRRRFAAITIRLHSPKTTALLFSSGITLSVARVVVLILLPRVFSPLPFAYNQQKQPPFLFSRGITLSVALCAFVDSFVSCLPHRKAGHDRLGLASNVHQRGALSAADAAQGVSIPEF